MLAYFDLIVRQPGLTAKFRPSGVRRHSPHDGFRLEATGRPGSAESNRSPGNSKIFGPDCRFASRTGLKQSVKCHTGGNGGVAACTFETTSS